MEPPISDPASSAVKPAARAAALPPEEPPGVRVGIPWITGCTVYGVVALKVREIHGHVGLP